MSTDRALDHVPLSTANALRTDLPIVQEAVRLGVTAKCAAALDKHWERWDKFCIGHNIDPFLRDWEDPAPILQVFGQRYRDGRLAPQKHAVRSRTVKDALRAIGQRFARMARSFLANRVVISGLLTWTHQTAGLMLEIRKQSVSITQSSSVLQHGGWIR